MEFDVVIICMLYAFVLLHRYHLCRVFPVTVSDLARVQIGQLLVRLWLDTCVCRGMPHGERVVEGESRLQEVAALPMCTPRGMTCR